MKAPDAAQPTNHTSVLVSGCVLLATFCQVQTVETAPSDVREHVTAIVTTAKDVYSDARDINCRVLLSNNTNATIFVLKESFSGGVWVDVKNHRIVLAHYAFTEPRENALRGGWTLWEVYHPQFYEIPAGARLALDWNVGRRHGPGQWRVEGQISALLDISPIVGMQGKEAAEAIARSDFLIPCAPKTITVK
jgi:hypothetical protein